MTFIVVLYIFVLMLALMSVLAAAYALAIQLFLASLVILAGVILAKYIKARRYNHHDPHDPWSTAYDDDDWPEFAKKRYREHQDQ